MLAEERLWQTQLPLERPAAAGILSSLLMPGEKIVHVASISSAVYWQACAMLAVTAGAALLSFTLMLYFLVISVVLFLIAHSTRAYLLLGVTDHRIVCRSGIIYADVTSLRFNAIESIDVVTSPLGALLGYGNVIVSGTGRMRFMVPCVSDAAAFRDAAVQMMEAAATPQTLPGSIIATR